VPSAVAIAAPRHAPHCWNRPKMKDRRAAQDKFVNATVADRCVSPLKLERQQCYRWLQKMLPSC